MTSNQPDLDHLDALHAAATPGPWHLTDSSAIVAPLTADTIADVWEPTAASRNGEFIEAAREAMPALVAEVRRLRAELERRTEDLAFLERNTLPELRREIDHHKDGKQRWRGRAEKAEARVWELERPAIEAKRGEIQLSMRQLAAQAREDGDYESESIVLQRLAAREEKWAREDAANHAAARSAAV